MQSNDSFKYHDDFRNLQVCLLDLNLNVYLPIHLMMFLTVYRFQMKMIIIHFCQNNSTAQKKPFHLYLNNDVIVALYVSFNFDILTAENCHFN